MNSKRSKVNFFPPYEHRTLVCRTPLCFLHQVASDQDYAAQTRPLSDDEDFVPSESTISLDDYPADHQHLTLDNWFAKKTPWGAKRAQRL